MSGWGKRRNLLGIAVLAFLANVVILSGLSRWLTLGAGLVLTFLLPGYLLARVLFPRGDAFNWIEHVVLSIGMGFGTATLGVLTLHYLPGPLPAFLVLVFCDGLILLLAALLVRRRDEAKAPASVPRAHLLALLTLVLVAAFLRFGNLGYSEFQGDESRALLMAAGVIRGEDGILFFHKKGPVEILLPTVFYALDGTIEEFAARFPFALANVVGVACVYVLTLRMFPRLPLAPPVAAGLLAVNGYLVAFGHLVQYQSVVFLMMALAAWCAYVWYRGDGNITPLILSVSFVAVGALAHYEAVLVLPLVGWLFWSRGHSEGWSVRRWAWHAVAVGIAFVVLTGTFYVPFALHPSFTDTTEYIVDRRIGGGVLHNNLGDFFLRATFYSSLYYIAFLVAGLLAFVTVQLCKWLRPAALAVVIVLVLLAGMVGAVLFPEALVVGGLNLAILPFTLALVLSFASPHSTTELRAALLWFGAPGLIAEFLMYFPKTHVYTMFPAWAILVGVILDRTVDGLARHVGHSPLAARTRAVSFVLAGVVLLTVFGYYEYIVFVRHDPDFRRGYPDTLPPFYQVQHRDDHPPTGGGGFGFPHRGAWKAVGALYAQGMIQGSYGANEETLTSSWYVRQTAWCRDTADYYFISSVVHDREKIPVERILQERALVGRVWADGQPVLEIYGSQPVDRVTDYDLAELEKAFDAAATPDVWLWALKDPTPQHRVDACLGGRVCLLGFDVSPQVAAGEALSLNLYWQVTASFDRDYSVFTHVEVEGESIWGQNDGTPMCGSSPTTKWEPGEVIVDGRVLWIDPATPPGEYPLLVGLYDPLTGQRVPVSGNDANERGDTVQLGTVWIVAPTSH